MCLERVNENCHLNGSGFSVAAPTSTSDRVCMPYGTCEVGTYKSADGTSTTDVVCTNLTICSEEQFQSSSSTPTTDRVCRNASRCVVDEFESVALTPTSDRECTQTSPPCSVGEEITANATATTDRVCSICESGTIDDDSDPTTPCVACTLGTYQDIPGSTICRRFDNVCPRGTAELAAPNATHGRLCRPCDGITQYQDEADQQECKNVTQECPAGTQYSGVTATVTSDRVCTACDGVVEYQPLPGQNGCLSIGQACPVGTFQSAEITPTSDRQCQRCSSGTYQNQSGQTSCIDVTNCEPGSRQFVPAAPYRDRICLPCALGSTYQPDTNQPSCLGVTPCVENAEFISVDATLTSDAVCSNLTSCPDAHFVQHVDLSRDRECFAIGDCPDDFYELVPATSTTDKICGELSVCEAGEYFEDEAPTATTDRRCSRCASCSSNAYVAGICSGSQNTVCVACGQCPDGTFEEEECTSTTNTVCTNCTVCDVEFGFFASTPCSENSNTECSRCRLCNQSFEYEASACTAEFDTTCISRTPCVEGEEWHRLPNDVNADNDCQPITTCTEDEFESSRPTRFTDRECSLLSICNETEFEFRPPTESMDRLCRTRTICGSTEAESIAPTVTSDRRCSPITLASVDDNNMSGGSSAALVIILILIIAGMIGFITFSHGKSRSHVVKEDAANIHIVGGIDNPENFWLFEEHDVETVPVHITLRKPKRTQLLGFDDDSDDGEDEINVYDVRKAQQQYLPDESLLDGVALQKFNPLPNVHPGYMDVVPRMSTDGYMGVSGSLQSPIMSNYGYQGAGSSIQSPAMSNDGYIGVMGAGELTNVSSGYLPVAPNSTMNAAYGNQGIQSYTSHVDDSSGYISMGGNMSPVPGYATGAPPLNLLQGDSDDDEDTKL